ncbi:MAG: hypothetical protein KJ709_09145 [Nanoarchaeota archaeon]|nr:hypothetical protein [Nanoarchaeota archaeon]
MRYLSDMVKGPVGRMATLVVALGTAASLYCCEAEKTPETPPPDAELAQTVELSVPEYDQPVDGTSYVGSGQSAGKITDAEWAAICRDMRNRAQR